MCICEIPLHFDVDIVLENANIVIYALNRLARNCIIDHSKVALLESGGNKHTIGLAEYHSY